MADEKPTFTGNIKDTPFPKLLCELNSMAISGNLNLKRGKAKKNLIISHGNPVKISSNLLQEVLGRFLVTRGKITSEQYEKTLDIASKSERRHGSVLIEEGFLTEEELLNLLKEQSIFKLLNLFKWVDGEYTFYRKDFTAPKGDFDGIPLTEIVLRGIKAGFSLDRLMNELSPYNDFYLFPGDVKPVFLDNTTLNDHEKWLFGITDGTKLARDIIEMSPLEVIDTHRLIYAGIMTNALEVREEGSTAAVEEKVPEKYDAFSSKILKTYHEMTIKNYFEVLDVSEDTPPLEIKRSYIKLAKEYHPDSFTPDILPMVEKTANKIFDIINNAYRILSNNDERLKYIKSLTNPEEEDMVEKTHNIMNAELQFQKGKVFLKKRDYPNARESFTWAAKLLPEEGEYLAYLGWVIYLNAKDKRGDEATRAVKYMKKAMTLNPSIETPHIFLGIIYKVQGMKDMAILHFKKALEINPNSIDAKREFIAINGTRSREESRGILGKKRR